MPNPKEKIRLTAKAINFTSQSIVYSVEFNPADKKDLSGISVSLPNIKHKDLIMKSTFIDKNNMEVVFTPIHVTPHFYQALHKKILKNYAEYENELDKIYKIGEAVGYIII